MRSEQLQQLITHLFRHESGKLIAVLTRILGFSNINTAEDIVQDTLMQAMNTWKIKGVPDNPVAWLYAVSKNKAIDTLRKQKQLEKYHQEQLLHSAWTLAPAVEKFFNEDEINDSVLRMMLVCCHPAIPIESQIAFTLKTLCGLDVESIARGFLTNSETIAKRIYRAKEKLKTEKGLFEFPTGEELTMRLDSLLKTLYLLFNEGYYATQSDRIIREELCEEAMRLCYLLTQHTLTNQPKTNALLSLMCFQASRFNARYDDRGQIVLLQDQDRSQWNQALIEKGRYFLNKASLGEMISTYHLEAAIGSCHALSKTFEETPWEKVLFLYEQLERINMSPVVTLNKAIAVSFVQSPARAMTIIQQIEPEHRDHYYYTALGDFLLRAQKFSSAEAAYEVARTACVTEQETLLLNKKINEAAMRAAAG